MQECVYHFRFDDGVEAAIRVDQAVVDHSALPHWTALEYHQCSNCPLEPATTPHCPMAVNMIKLVELTGNRRSYDGVDVRVETNERSVSKTTSIQTAVGSLMGLLAATSDCPQVAFLKAMAQFHLPFSSEKETLYRVASTYLLAQYFLRQNGREPDWDLTELRAHYDELQIVNQAIVERLRAGSKKDGAINALVVLDSFAKTLQFSIDDALEEIRPVFEYYRGS